jgi:peptide-methionine (S)-S-oxide reductase
MHSDAEITSLFSRGISYAGDYHQQQQYLAKSPDGDCGLKGTGISCPIGGSVQVAAH